MSLVGHQPPPIFRRGPAPLARLFVFVALCLVLLVADLRFRYLEVLRNALSVVTYPLQMAASTPADVVRNASRYFGTLVDVQLENAELRRHQLGAGERLLRFEQLEQENLHLRELLQMSQRVQTKSIAADILYNAPDPFARKVILDRGTQQGVEAGLAVLDANGVIGQVTRVHPVQSEVTLLTDRNQSIPVSVVRNGVRGVLYGVGRGMLEMRHVLAEVDIQPGDRLVTSGLDGIFVPGLPVATVTRVDRDQDAFARIECEPLAAIERSVQVLVIGRAAYPPPPPPPEPAGGR
ncbi:MULTISPECIES: rod shape-determining protein MreC [Thauera]|jgi:rod shape-determining protein MreC|uniref:Cell shape-determining protein MreC n=1 Tax=Thauera aminoaromatica TaxID=164330 RepID=C4ZMI8_THASP|nr:MULTISPECIES: rod shape-determining protein MreC [Thauera]MDA0235676.1 rod shape-determining protein MreC [Pseudomonadota bacterium]OPZ06523.1 MAG: Cell shape-determining protein MreC [Alphaproteobacteria bacterium ADurb.BinA305]TMW77144.1 rod shape-determining protein MreC [Thauera sp. UPWRP]ACK53032.1 rod shape-determining protein MreC [Thauera aminoaromatica]KIN91801.1 rod shape-determining protein MreC [Thauera sp. SWB20]